MSLQIKLISEDSRTILYGYETEFDKLYFHFDKNQKTVGIRYDRFILKNNVEDWTTQDESIKYSCKYGHWQAETPYLCKDDIEFIYNTMNELNKRGAKNK